MAVSVGPGQSEVVILLLGEKQSGKTSVGNSILDRQAFHKRTSCSCKESGTVFGIQVTVVDTPGWSSHPNPPHQVSQELCRGLRLCDPQPHVILLVLPLTNTFGPREWKAMEVQLRLFHIPIWQRTMILFTHGDSLGVLSLEEHIKQQSKTLCWLLERCGNRYHIMTNQPGGSKLQVKELLTKICKITEDNDCPKEFRNEMYTKLRREVSMREERRTKQREEEIKMRMMYDVYDGIPWQKQLMNSAPVNTEYPTGQSALNHTLGLILLGRRKSGKSSVGNAILNKEVFKMNTKTVHCSAGHGVVLGQSVTVVDTPGWSQFGLANPQNVRMEISSSPSLCPIGSKVVFLLAIPVASFKEKDRKAVAEYLSVLGKMVWRNTVVLFTYGDELRGRTVTKYIKEKGNALNWVVDRCGQRHHVFDSNTDDMTQVEQILKTAQRL